MTEKTQRLGRNELADVNGNDDVHHAPPPPYLCNRVLNCAREGFRGRRFLLKQ